MAKKLLTKRQIAENKKALASIVKALKIGPCAFNHADLYKILDRSLAIIKHFERPKRSYS